MNRKHVAVYGGSFNPIHKGHLALAQHILDHQIADEVLFMPTPAPPHKSGKMLASFDDRCQMIMHAIKDKPRMSFSTLEAGLSKPSFTLQTLDELSSHMLDAEFSWVIGADELNQLHTWKPDPIRLVRSYNFITYLRKGVTVDLSELNKYWPGWICKKLLDGVVFDADILEVSSSSIRDRIAHTKSTRIQELTSSVRQYIADHGLYGADPLASSSFGDLSFDAAASLIRSGKIRYAYWATRSGEDPKHPVGDTEIIYRLRCTKHGSIVADMWYPEMNRHTWYVTGSAFTKEQQRASTWLLTVPDLPPWNQNKWLKES